jgi:hypothetical protein
VARIMARLGVVARECWPVGHGHRDGVLVLACIAAMPRLSRAPAKVLVIAGRTVLVLGGGQLVVPAPQVIPIMVIPIAGAVVIPVAVAIPIMIPVPILLVPAQVIPIAVMVATVIPVSVTLAPRPSPLATVPLPVMAIFGKVAVQVRALLVQAPFFVVKAMLVAGKLTAFFTTLTNPAVALFLPDAIAVADGAELIRVVVAHLLEPVDSLGQLLAVDAVVCPAADDLTKSPAEGAAAGLILGRPPQPIEFLAKLRARSQGAQRPQR